ncbi:MAG: hypothetical protein Q9217_002583 [Psora testacea]
MSLKEAYKGYLKNPTVEALSDNASLHYISTLTTINTSTAIAKHNAAHKKILRKKEENILSCIEGRDALCVDIETTLEFLSSGGAYLPGLDDNFVSDRTVTFPVVHIIHYDANQKIQQIRLYWDQGSLLKQIDVIGARARNWPIRDGKDQARLIALGASGNEQDSRPSTAVSSTSSREPGTAGKPRSQSNNVTRDPHASLALFAPRDQEVDSSAPAVFAPRPSAKPAPRNYHDLFVGDDSDASPQTRKRPTSPTKENEVVAPKAASAKPPPRDYHDLFVGNESDSSPQAKGPTSPSKELMSPPIAPKSGAGKNYKPSRLFDVEEDDPTTPKSPEKGQYMKPHPSKYQHFEFGNVDDAPAAKADRPKTKHQSQWDFEDFTTPQKPYTKSRPGDQDKRHFGWEDDNAIMDSPTKHPAIAKSRPDANTNFDFQDDGTPQAGRRPPGNSLGGINVRTTGLYQNNVIGENDQLVPSQEKKQESLSTVTNLKDRRKDFDPHFSMTDSTPSQAGEPSKRIPEARAKVVSQMGAQWEASDASPSATSLKGNGKVLSSNDKENLGPKNMGIKSGGDGMGGKKGAGRSWGFGDESDEDGVGGMNGGKFQASKKQQRPKDSGIWDF